MKSHKLFSLFFALIFTLSLVSCDKDDDANPDFATAVAGTYSSNLDSDAVLATRTGDNEITFSNATGTPLSADIVVTISAEKTEDVNFGGVVIPETTYTVSNSDVILKKTQVLGVDVITLTINAGSDTFSGTKS